MDPDWYAAWQDQAFEELLEKNHHLETEFKVGHWTRYDYNLLSNTLTFSEQGVPKVVAEIQVAGTTGADDWLWAWANESLPAESAADAARVRAFGQKHGIEVLLDEQTTSGAIEAVGWKLAAVMVRVTSALGAYRAPSRNGGLLFLTLKRIAWMG
jgi:hypothetical protein